jgi:hypothetical protein
MNPLYPNSNPPNERRIFVSSEQYSGPVVKDGLDDILVVFGVDRRGGGSGGTLLLLNAGLGVIPAG